MPALHVSQAEHRRRMRLVRGGEWNQAWLVLRDGREVFAEVAVEVAPRTDGTCVRVRTEVGDVFIDPCEVTKAVR